MAKGDERPKRKAGPMTGMVKKARKSAAVAKATIALAGGGSGFGSDAKRFRARQLLAACHTDLFPRGADSFMDVYGTPSWTDELEAEYAGFYATA